MVRERGNILAMSSNPVYLLKGSEDSISINRTIKIVADEGKPFVVSVTDRDYQHDPSGQALTIIFQNYYGSIEDAATEVEKQVGLSLEEGFVHNRLSMI